MSYRVLALAPVLFALACGNAAPASPPKDPSTAPADSGAAPVSTQRAASFTAGEDPSAKAKDDSHPPTKGPGLGSYHAAEGAGATGTSKAPEAAVVDTKEPLGG